MIENTEFLVVSKEDVAKVRHGKTDKNRAVNVNALDRWYKCRASFHFFVICNSF